MADKNPDNAWHLDRRVPIALLVGLLIQTFGAAWWLSKLESRVDSVGMVQAVLKDDVKEIERNNRQSEPRMIRLEEKFVALNKTMENQGKTLKEILIELRNRPNN